MTALRSRMAIARFLIVLGVLLAADLWVKHAAFEQVAGVPVSNERDENGNLPPIPAHHPTVLIPKVLALQLTFNEGAVFGLGQGGRWVFVAFSLIATVVIVNLFAKSPANAWGQHILFGAILAGAFGNMYDRLTVGAVRDMLLAFPGVKLPFGWTWGGGSDGLYPWIFNVADVCLVGGLILGFIMMYRADRAAAKARKDNA